MRRKLEHELDAWYSNWYEKILEPALLPLQEQYPSATWPERGSGQPETLVLPLPSSWPSVGLDSESNTTSAIFAETELHPRRGQANDVLHEIWSKIGLYSFIWKKTAGQFGQGAKTRNAKTVENTRQKIDDLRSQYEVIQKKLIALGELETNYPPLTPKDCTPINIEHGHEEPGESKKITSWIWRDSGHHGDMNLWQSEGKFMNISTSCLSNMVFPSDSY